VAELTGAGPAAVWQNRIVGHADVPPAELVPNPRNWRTHPPEQRQALAGALTEVGWVGEVLVNRTTGRVVDGHLRIELALDRHEPAVPVTYVELTEDEERVVLASLDPIGAMADAEATAFEDLLADLEPADRDLRAFLDELSRQHGFEHVRAGLVDPDEAPDVPAEPTVRLGELYALGDHRLLCGDATDAASVRRAFGQDARADLIWTDPPYGVAYQTKLSTEEAVARHRRTDGLEVANDQPEDIPALLAATFGHAPVKPGGAFYVASPSSGDVLPAFYSALRILVEEYPHFGRHSFRVIQPEHVANTLKDAQPGVRHGVRHASPGRRAAH